MVDCHFTASGFFGKVSQQTRKVSQQSGKVSQQVGKVSQHLFAVKWQVTPNDLATFWEQISQKLRSASRTREIPTYMKKNLKVIVSDMSPIHLYKLLFNDPFRGPYGVLKLSQETLRVHRVKL